MLCTGTSPTVHKVHPLRLCSVNISSRKFLLLRYIVKEELREKLALPADLKKFLRAHEMHPQVLNIVYQWLPSEELTEALVLL